MLYQIVTTLVSLVLGSVLTMVVTYFTQAMNHKTEKRKVARDKLEELYVLSFQLKNWGEDTCSRLGILYDSPPGTNYTSSPLECPIDRIEILTRLYAPSLKNIAIELHDRVRKIQTVLKRFWEPYEEYGDDEIEEIELSYNQRFANLVYEASEEFKVTHERFLSSLERLILQS